MKDRARIDGRAILLPERRDIGDERPPESDRERRHEVASLIGVRDKDTVGLLLREERDKGEHVPVGCVARQRGVIDNKHFVDGRRRELGRNRVDPGTKDGDLYGFACVLRRRNGFPRRAIEYSVALLCYNQDHSFSPFRRHYALTVQSRWARWAR